jgi:hypothetical protein
LQDNAVCPAGLQLNSPICNSIGRWAATGNGGEDIFSFSNPTGQTMPKIPSRPALDLSSKWVVELPSLPPDYLAQTPDPHVLIRHDEFYRFTATYQFGAQRGEIDGRVDEVWPRAAQIFLTFAGTDEGKEVFGAAGDVGYNASDEEEVINGTFRYHHGDDLPFVWKRVRQANPARKRPRR